MSCLTDRLSYVFLKSETVAVRAFFGIMSLLYGIFIPQTEGQFEYAVALQWFPAWLWSAAMVTNGLAIFVGVLTQRYNLVLLLLEGALGMAAWLTLGVATSISQGVPGPTFAAAFVAIWIFVRYPSWK